MNATPRTDAALDAMSRDLAGFSEIIFFARTLERELAAATARAERAEEAIGRAVANDIALRADNAALRAALEKILKSCATSQEADDIAREALRNRSK